MNDKNVCTPAFTRFLIGGSLSLYDADEHDISYGAYSVVRSKTRAALSRVDTYGIGLTISPMRFDYSDSIEPYHRVIPEYQEAAERLCENAALKLEYMAAEIRKAAKEIKGA